MKTTLMNFPSPLLPGILIKRYKRFLADIKLDSGEEITAHCANPGSLFGATDPGLKVWVSHAPSPTRKLPYSWQIVEIDNTLVGVNTSLPNSLAEEAILANRIPELSGYSGLKREVKYSDNSRIDILLMDANKPPCYVEVKNVHMKRGTSAQFPDSVTTRGTKHLRDLEKMAAQGARAVMLYVIQRDDCDTFSFAADIDPVYANTAAHAFENGVEALAYGCAVTPQEIQIANQIDIILR